MFFQRSGLKNYVKRNFIQYLNNLNARRADEYSGISNSNDRKAISTSDLKISTKDVLGIEEKETTKITYIDLL